MDKYNYNDQIKQAKQNQIVNDNMNQVQDIKQISLNLDNYCIQKNIYGKKTYSITLQKMIGCFNDKINRQQFYNLYTNYQKDFVLTEQEQEIIWSLFQQNQNQQTKGFNQNLSVCYLQKLLDIYVLCYDIFLLLDKDWTFKISKDDHFVKDIICNNIFLFYKQQQMLDIRQFTKILMQTFNRVQILDLWSYIYSIKSQNILIPYFLQNWCINTRYNQSKQRFQNTNMFKLLHQSGQQQKDGQNNNNKNYINKQENNNKLLKLIDIQNKAEQLLLQQLNFEKNPIGAIQNLISLILDVQDYFSDILVILQFYKAASQENQQNYSYMIFVVIYTLCELSPYLIAYSSGIQLFNSQNIFQNKKDSCFIKFLKSLLLTPLGILYFIFLHFLDIFIVFAETLINLPFTTDSFFKKSQRFLQNLPNQFGFQNSDFQGYKVQKQISQLMFETFPIGILNILLLTNVLYLEDMQDAQIILLFSTISTILKVVKELIQIYFTAKYLKEGTIEYGIIMIKARYNWLPYKNQVGLLDLHYSHICYPSLFFSNLLGQYETLDYTFTQYSLNEFKEQLQNINQKKVLLNNQIQVIEKKLNQLKNTDMNVQIKEIKGFNSELNGIFFIDNKKSVQEILNLIVQIKKQINSQREISIIKGLENLSFQDYFLFINYIRQEEIGENISIDFQNVITSKALEQNIRKVIEKAKRYQKYNLTYEFPWGQQFIDWVIQNIDHIENNLLEQVLMDFNLNQKNQQGKYPIYNLVQQQKSDIFAKALQLNKEIKLNLLNNDCQESVLYYLMQDGRYKEGAVHKQMADYLIDHLRSFNQLDNYIDELISYKGQNIYQGNPPLFQAIAQKNELAFDKIIEITKTINQYSYKGENIIQFCINEMKPKFLYKIQDKIDVKDLFLVQKDQYYCLFNLINDSYIIQDNSFHSFFRKITIDSGKFVLEYVLTYSWLILARNEKGKYFFKNIEISKNQNVPQNYYIDLFFKELDQIETDHPDVRSAIINYQKYKFDQFSTNYQYINIFELCFNTNQDIGYILIDKYPEILQKLDSDNIPFLIRIYQKQNLNQISQIQKQFSQVLQQYSYIFVQPLINQEPYINIVQDDFEKSKNILDLISRIDSVDKYGHSYFYNLLLKPQNKCWTQLWDYILQNNSFKSQIQYEEIFQNFSGFQEQKINGFTPFQNLIQDESISIDIFQQFIQILEKIIPESEQHKLVTLPTNYNPDSF
ncbi:hypothetical protein PPERSA_08825 [Pseudocohnilembus persalinus]|uniref:Uncharacterized protein n=1 Tax=Pseudocohnilembus persalinus TaxID=266149 RepID=A0A0V0R4E9_PSEPJ|nr:hypothetical protein PPERSA_08825 [Pseudocohnilembus persalinus]|eukprot:KRX09109.1 hypothetical protein PPERSA_08825 [Pseudocohnilembus persalinus]